MGVTKELGFGHVNFKILLDMQVEVSCRQSFRAQGKRYMHGRDRFLPQAFELALPSAQHSVHIQVSAQTSPQWKVTFSLPPQARSIPLPCFLSFPALIIYLAQSLSVNHSLIPERAFERRLRLESASATSSL